MNCIDNKWIRVIRCIVWEGSFCSSVATEGPCAHSLGGAHSCAKSMVLWCKSGLYPHTCNTSSPLQNHPWSTVFSPNWKKVKKFRVIHPTFQITSELVCNISCVSKVLSISGYQMCTVFHGIWCAQYFFPIWCAQLFLFIWCAQYFLCI